MQPIPDEACPECHGPFTLVLASHVRLRKRCLDCGHMWSEAVSPPLMQDGYVNSDFLDPMETP
jgi:hypothetical protein